MDHTIALPPRAQLAQVECNAPLSGVRYHTERGESPDATMAAKMHRAKAAQAKMEQEVHTANFRRETLKRLRAAARARRAAEDELKAESLARVASAANAALVSTERAGEGASDPSPALITAAQEPAPACDEVSYMLYVGVGSTPKGADLCTDEHCC